mgnify:CR=1 FL=1
MTFTIIISAIAVILGGICYLLAKANKKNKVLYREEVERNKRLSDEIYRLGEMERVRHEARTETERKISEVDSLNGIDRFNAINDVLSDNN